MTGADRPRTRIVSISRQKKASRVAIATDSAASIDVPKLAAANRLTARLDEAFSALAEAETMAAAGRDDRALAELHYLRGSLHFARAELSACRAEHERALEAARRINSPEWQARALERTRRRAVHRLPHGGKACAGALARGQGRDAYRCAQDRNASYVKPTNSSVIVLVTGQ